ncbi:hypothetical protein SAMN05660649_03031 [Desulfotomaculum arcticum]|uniref:Uncharacterized protein n=1 Tax=Desulfotruncus arcticus DSM 17038 TaxID=1121424 RepID=A0A1I2VHY1_9FIRM|nr:hypothetical protein [Desulfotruncus arcticus]SFG88924.1 hypothetical protein SAMN05660649_03031 [Desulfotomaculum arcticum] [Desulfotruncus arcticus DSM 17038]
MVSIACLGVLILCGTFIWKGETGYGEESIAANESAAEVAEPQKTAAAPATPYYSASPQPSPQPDPLEQMFISGAKVGDIIKLGDVEMQVTKAPAKHKVIDLTLSGNSLNQSPELIRSENNRIMYEIPADVDVHLDITEKIIFDQ